MSLVENLNKYRWDVYMFINPIGETYIGRTKNFTQRKNTYKCGNDKCTKLIYNSIVKYGFDSHELKIIDTFYSTKEYADDKEMFWIRSFMSNRNKWPEMGGMNLTDGGPGQIGGQVSDKQREAGKRMSVNIKGWNKGIKMSDKARRNMSVSQKVAVNLTRFKKGHTPSESTINKISAANKGKISKKRKPILVYEQSTGHFIKEVSWVGEACTEFDVFQSGVKKVLLGYQKSTHGYIFKYKDK